MKKINWLVHINVRSNSISTKKVHGKTVIYTLLFLMYEKKNKRKGVSVIFNIYRFERVTNKFNIWYIIVSLFSVCQNKQ